MAGSNGENMLHRGLSIVLLICALFSGQLLASSNGHAFYSVQNPDHQLRHEADSDEIRGRARDAADELSEDHHQLKSRRPPQPLR
ncbi:DUF2554 domain-containing protein [Pluralibacter gergoviae]|nr:Protein of uncharacterised function (DUF2554) [Pluralibacter gergoviae]